MNANLKTLCALVLAFACATLPTTITATTKADAPNVMQTSATANALQRGYRTGYSDGYMSGYRDVADGATKDFRNKEDYARANRAYDTAYGTADDYRSGYRQGFEIGYAAGYDHHTFDSTVPNTLSRNSNSSSNGNISTNETIGTSTASDIGNASTQTRVEAITIPESTVLRVELLNNLSTEASQRGDTFEARVIEPQQFQNATVSGHISRVKRPGKLRGNAELQLSFDELRFPDNRRARFDAQLIEVVQAAGNGVGKVDTEGGVQGKNSRKDDATKIGAGAGVGAIIGAIAGGVGGAAIGAVIGGAVGTGGVLASRGKDIYLPRGQQLRIRTSTPVSTE
ncbi:MAG: hypothetical protein ACR2LC_01565 [Pyrinomonadaceae bacterium]